MRELRGVGDAPKAMYIMLTSTFLNVVLDPILIFGWGPIPAMGVVGAALATVLQHHQGVIDRLVDRPATDDTDDSTHGAPPG